MIFIFYSSVSIPDDSMGEIAIHNITTNQDIIIPSLQENIESHNLSGPPIVSISDESVNNVVYSPRESINSVVYSAPQTPTTMNTLPALNALPVIALNTSPPVVDLE